MNRIDEIRERLEAATPGPWEWAVNGVLRSWRMASVLLPVLSSDGKIELGTQDADLIAHAPDDLRHLLDEHERLTAENARLRRIARAAFVEGWWAGAVPHAPDEGTADAWQRSSARAALTEEPQR